MAADRAEYRRHHPDVWGKICTDYLEGGKGLFVLRRDDGLVEEASVKPYFRDTLSPQEEAALEAARGTALDIGCGPGRHALALQQRGLDVTGIDISPGTVEVARRRGCRDVQSLSLWDLDGLQRRFSTVLMMGNNAGLPGTLENVTRFLQYLRAHTTQDAVLIAMSLDPTETDRPEHLAYHQRNQRKGRYKGEVRLRLEYQDLVSPWWNLVHMEPGVFRGLCEDNGWAVRELIDARPSYYLIAGKT